MHTYLKTMATHFSVLVLTIAMILPFAETRQDVSISGAFYSGVTLYFFNDQQQVLSMSDNEEATVYNQDLFGAPHNFQVTAAIYEESQLFTPIFIFFGRERIYFGEELNFSVDFDRFSFRFPEFVWHGIDAAATEGDTDYYFKGCEFITRSFSDGWDINPRPVSDLQLPCDVDAAWNDGMDAFVLKGNQVWIVGNSIDEPIMFDEYFYQNKWELRPKSP